MLGNLESKSIKDKVEVGAIQGSDVLYCPNCSNKMDKVDYNLTGIIIDSCTACPYRWLDAGEVAKIQDDRSISDVDDLLFLLKVNERLKELDVKNEVSEDERNPRLPLQGSYRSAAGLTGSMRGIAGAGIYGLIKGLLVSKFTRILLLVSIVIFILLYILIYVDYRFTFG